MDYHERPGIYSNYEMSTVLVSGSGNQTVALAAEIAGSGLLTITSVSQAEKLLSSETVALNLVRLLLLNGAGTVLVYPAADDSVASYSTAAKMLLAEKKASFLICDCEYEDVQEELKNVILAAAEEGNECIGVVSMASTAVTPMISRAETLNSERMILVTGSAKLSWDEKSGGIYGAAAVAGLLAGEADPAVPVHGVALKGLVSVSQRFTEAEIDSLVQGGVSQLESLGGAVSLIRAVTTRTTTDGVADASWREVTTIRIVDDVIPGVRNALKAKFIRKKNNETTRGAIRSQVVVELENRKNREIINDYGDISVTADEDDPTICVVTFSFVVAKGLSRIYLTAYITV